MKRRDLLKRAAAGAVSVTAAPVEEWRRSKLDFAVYVPEKLQDSDAENQQFLVLPLPGGTLTLSPR
jgi:hypothetical protein